jgi:hypothetical protein
MRQWIDAVPRRWAERYRDNALSRARAVLLESQGAEGKGPHEVFAENEAAEDDWNAAWEGSPVTPVNAEDQGSDRHEQKDSQTSAENETEQDDEDWGWGDAEESTEKPKAKTDKVKIAKVDAFKAANAEVMPSHGAAVAKSSLADELAGIISDSCVVANQLDSITVHVPGEGPQAQGVLEFRDQPAIADVTSDVVLLYLAVSLQLYHADETGRQKAYGDALGLISHLQRLGLGQEEQDALVEMSLRYYPS